MNVSHYFMQILYFILLFFPTLIEMQRKINDSIFKDAAYDIYVKTDKNKNELCKELHGGCDEYGLKLKNGSLYVPVNPNQIIDHTKCEIQPECAYNITLKTVDRNFGTTIFYHVPECVDNVCSCHHEHLLPNVSLDLSPTSKKDGLIVHWTLVVKNSTSILSYLEDLYISIIELNGTDLDWGKYRDLSNVKVELHYFDGVSRKIRTEERYTQLFKVFNPPFEKRRFLVRAYVTDERGCKGIENKKSITVFTPVASHQEKSNKGRNLSEITLILLSAFIVLILFGILLVLWKQRKNSFMTNWPKVYRGISSSHSGLFGPSSMQMQENVMYIESDDDPIELPHCALRVGREIGKGAFGKVFLARLDKSILLNKNYKFDSDIVAVKQLKKRPTTDQLEEFLGEIATMRKVGRHSNIVNLIGFCTKKQPLLMVMEFIGCGDLLHYLRKVRKKHEAKFPQHFCRTSNATTALCNDSGATTNFNSCISNSNASNLSNSSGNVKNSNPQNTASLVKYLDILHSHSSNSTTDSSSYITQPEVHPTGTNAVRISFAETMYTDLSVNIENSLQAKLSALEYIVDHNELHSFAVQIARGMKHLEEKQITHRDLAARNILIDENKTLKISDFGLSRSGIYVNTKNKKVPLRWLSIEAIKDRLYSSKSDVWAFAIVLWEIGTLGGFPYPTIHNHELLQFLKRGDRLERPENCSQFLYDLMLECWSEDPENRPSFKSIVSRLDPNKSKVYIDFDEIDPNYVFPPTCEEFRNKTKEVLEV